MERGRWGGRTSPPVPEPADRPALATAGVGAYLPATRVTDPEDAR